MSPENEDDMFKDDIIGFSEGRCVQSATSLRNSPLLGPSHAHPELMTIHVAVEKAPAWPSLVPVEKGTAP